MSALEQLFAADGPLSTQLEQFSPREEQVAMAKSVAAAVLTDETLVVEAGTGIGKTLGYLIPVLRSGKRALISTGTRTLQDQLFQRDLPLAVAVVDLPIRAALLKGRGNYLCHYRLERTLDAGRFETRQAADLLQRLRIWAGRTSSGDLADFPDESVPGRLQPMVTSTADNCLNQDCPFYSDCFVMKARREAQDADVVVVNHHLLMADWAIREGGFGEVLPSADVHVLDEAHQLPEIAGRFFGMVLSGRQLSDLGRDVRLEQLREAGDAGHLSDLAGELERASADLRLVLGDDCRDAWARLPRESKAPQAAGDLLAVIYALVQALEPQAPRGTGLESCYRRMQAVHADLQRFLHEEDADSDYVRWVETVGTGYRLRMTPLDVAAPFAAGRERNPGAWIFTSATLSVRDQFSHFTGRLGLQDAETRRFDSPFDYRSNALLYVPESIPAPSEAGFIDAYLDRALEVLEMSGGRAFMLFTSHRALQMAAQRLRAERVEPLLVQGDANPQRLLDQFRERGNAVLLGTQSFWEGVDVRGPALSCVMIDRLPFGSPGDPVLQARIDWFREQGRNPFADLQLPDAVISLRQGVGRLIRGPEDRGLLMVGDHRLLTKSYGRVFRESLPPVPLTRDPAAIADFFA
ncbi:MAG: ATP-dependent DNA helicase [Gammaproteobacteria bacterium]|nr:ATP-dependent DNA helicase [Gammaproteobacteria bacterium]